MGQELASSPGVEDVMGLTGRKTAMGGALNLGLIASNSDQLLNIVTTSYKNFDALDLTKIVLLGISLTTQVNFVISLGNYIFYFLMKLILLLNVFDIKSLFPISDCFIAYSCMDRNV